MSIGSALLAGTAGLRANASAVAAISDNIVNVNTVGYKRLRNDFTALLHNQANQRTHNAGGVSAQATALTTEQGPLQASAVSTHLAISGNGYFVTRDRAGDAGADDAFNYTRAGQFSPDSDGYLKNASGQYLHGWALDENGEVTASPTDLTALSPVRVSGFGGAAEATTRVSLSANLEAGLTPNAAAYAAGTPAQSLAGFINGGAGIEPDFSTTVQIYDSLGGRHNVTFAFLKDAANPNRWYAEAIVEPATDVTDTTGTLHNGQIAAGYVQFDSSGQLDLANSTVLNNTPLTIGATGGAGLVWNTGNLLAEQTITLDVGGTNSPVGLTQYDTESVLDTSQVNGVAFGALSAIEVDDEGYVVAQFANGLNRRIYQIPLATFSNNTGLSQRQGGVYTAGPDAGALNLKGSNQSDAGSISSYALEASTVDLAEEFSNLITTQRAYSASSKIITTADEMLNELINLKR